MTAHVFSVRRLPGTISLLLTNLIASGIIVDGNNFRTSPLFEAARDTAPLWVWSTLWFLSAVGLFVAVIRRSINWLHAAAGLSIAVWTAFVVGVWWVGATDPDVVLSPIARSLFAWVLLSQLSMILAPLIWPRDTTGGP